MFGSIKNFADSRGLTKEINEPCFVCEREGIPTGKLFYYGSTTTLVGYGGGHNDNCRVGLYSCSNKHNYTVRKRNVCKECGWKGKEECFCHPLGVKILIDEEHSEEIKIYAEHEVQHEGIND